MSAANVRHHLSVLKSDNLVRVVGKAKKEIRGRPVNLYGLNESLLGNNLAYLSHALLDELSRSYNTREKEQFMRTLGFAMKEKLCDVNSNASMSARLVEMVNRLTENHYQARWEAGADGPRILFGRCPYSEIIQAHPELCRMDQSMLESAAGVVASQSAKIGTQGSPVCIFLIREISR